MIGSQNGFQLRGAGWSSFQPLTQKADHPGHVEVLHLVPDHALPPLPTPGPDAGQENGIVGGGNGVDRAAHERPLDRGAIHQRFGQGRPAEISQSRPQPYVAARRVLRLQAADRFQRACQRER